MSYKHTAEKLAGYRRQIGELRQKMRDVQAAVEPEAVKDYTFRRAGGGSLRLSELFGDKADLFVIHNMGQSCPYCTLSADGFNGAYAHLSNRAAFVLSSPDSPDKQRKFAESRHWRFPMVSHEGTTFTEDMGYRQDGGWMPGVSVFRRQNGGNRAGVRRAVLARRRFLQRLALLRSHSRRRRRLAAEVQVRVRLRHAAGPGGLVALVAGRAGAAHTSS
jgi:predicted dithiol-disulfide oxidoreductase (DUF899 family)